MGTSFPPSPSFIFSNFPRLFAYSWAIFFDSATHRTRVVTFRHYHKHLQWWYSRRRLWCTYAPSFAHCWCSPCLSALRSTFSHRKQPLLTKCSGYTQHPQLKWDVNDLMRWLPNTSLQLMMEYAESSLLQSQVGWDLTGGLDCHKE